MTTKSLEAVAHVERTRVLTEDVDYTRHEMRVGDHHWQGDVAVRYIGALPSGLLTGWEGGMQLAPGTTQGSRHVILDEGQVKLYTRPNATPLEGPIVEARAPWTLTHPEHRHATFPAGVYEVWYQRQFAQELQRVQD